MFKPLTLKAILILAGCIFALTACTSKEEKAIQGKWANGNAHFWAEWNFVAGSYSYYYDNNFTNIYETGRYRIVKRGDDYIDIELFNRKGSIQEVMGDSVEMRIGFKKEGVINIQNSEYTLVFESSLRALETANAGIQK